MSSQTISHRVCICLELLLVSLDLRERVLDPVHAALDLVVHPRDLPLQDVVVRILARVAYLGEKGFRGEKRRQRNTPSYHSGRMG